MMKAKVQSRALGGGSLDPHCVSSNVCDRIVTFGEFVQNVVVSMRLKVSLSNVKSLMLTVSTKPATGYLPTFPSVSVLQGT